MSSAVSLFNVRIFLPVFVPQIKKKLLELPLSSLATIISGFSTSERVSMGFVKGTGIADDVARVVLSG